MWKKVELTEGYDRLGERVVIEKMRSLGWTPAQCDRFLDYLYTEVSVDYLVTELLRFATTDWLNSEADALGIFEVDDDDGKKLLSDATDAEIIAFAEHEGYTLTIEDCQAIMEGERDGETICEAVNDFLDAYER